MALEALKKQFEARFIVIDYQYSLVLLQKSFRGLEKVARTARMQAVVSAVQRWRELTLLGPRNRALDRIDALREAFARVSSFSLVLKIRYTQRLASTFGLLKRHLSQSKTQTYVKEAEDTIRRVNQEELREINDSIQEQLLSHEDLSRKLNALKAEEEEIILKAESSDRESRIRNRVSKLTLENEALTVKYSSLENDVARFIEYMGNLLEGKDEPPPRTEKRKYFTITL